MKTINPNPRVTKRGDGRHSVPNEYTSTFSRIPTFEEICETQCELGFHVAGYGVPYNIVIRQLPSSGGYNVTWLSASGCD